MLETDHEGAKWLKEMGEADQAMLNLVLPLQAPTGLSVIQALNKNAERKYQFQEWVLTKRFHAANEKT